jgi:hypothetical protein
MRRQDAAIGQCTCGGEIICAGEGLFSGLVREVNTKDVLETVSGWGAHWQEGACIFVV